MFTKGIIKTYPLNALLASLVILLAACSSPTPASKEASVPPSPVPHEAPALLQPVSQQELVGETWQWIGGREKKDGPVYQITDPENYTLSFSEDGKLLIVADCNTSPSTFELTGDQMKINLGATTLAACPPESRSDQFLNQIEQAASVGTGFGNLVILLAGDGGEMYFRRAQAVALGADLAPIGKDDLVDILWQWTSLVEVPPGAEVGVGAPENYDLVFRADGTYSAKADCNQLSGVYELEGTQLTLKQGITSLAMCPPDSRYDQYMSSLTRVTGVGPREGLLVLILDEGVAEMAFVNAGKSPVAIPPPSIKGDPATVLGTPNGVENFDNTNNWSLFDAACFTTEITGGQLVMTANGVAESSCWEVSWPQLENFYIETTVQMPDTCNPQDRFGLLFRAPDTNRGYLYGYSCNGQYSLTIWDGEATTVLVPPTASPEILAGLGAVNRMGLLAFGENYSLYANGVYLGTVSDFTFLDAGRIGYFVRALTTDPFTVRYYQLRVWVLEDEFFPPVVAQPLPPIDVPAPPANVPTGEARVNVNVRSGPSMLFPVLGTAQQGDTGEILGTNPDGSWFAISVPTNLVGTGIGWSAANLVNLTNPTGAPLPVITPPLLPTTLNFPAPRPNAPQATMREPATIRSGPTMEFPVFGVAPSGSRSEVIGESQDGEWWAVRIPTSLSSDGTGWVRKVFTLASNLPASISRIQTPQLPGNITPSAPASGAPSLITYEPLNVRTGPGNNYPSLGRVGIGSVMAVVGVSPDREHYVVNVPRSIDPSGQGWVPARFVRSENTSRVPIVQPPPLP